MMPPKIFQKQRLISIPLLTAAVILFIAACAGCSTTDKNASSKIEGWNEKAWNCRNTTPATAWLYADSAQQQAIITGNQPGLSDAYMRKAVIFMKLGRPDSSLSFYYKALNIRKSLGDQLGVARIQSGLGTIYSLKNRHEEAIELHLEAIALFDAKGDSLDLANAVQNLSTSYKRAGKDSLALETYFHCLSLFTSINNLEGISDIQYNLGIFFYYKDELKKARKYFEKSLSVKLQMPEMGAAIREYNSIGVVLIEEGNSQKAIDSLLMPALVLASSLDLKEQLPEILYNISWAYEEMGILDSALHYQVKYGDELESQNHNLNPQILDQLQTVERIRKEEKRANHNRTLAIIFASMMSIFAIGGLAYFFRTRMIISRQNEAHQKEKLGLLFQSQQLQSLKDILKGQKQERTRLARELHNRLGNLLAGVKLNLESIESSTSHWANPRHQKLFEQATSTLDQSCERLSKIAHDLDSEQIKKFGLVVELNNLVRVMNDSGFIKASLDTNGLEERLSSHMELILYDILIELINNVLKHAQATEVSIQVIRDQDELRAMVEDNGVGIDLQKLKESKGFGVKKLETIISDQHGKFLIDPSPIRGTISMVTLPLHIEEEEM